MYLKDNNVNSGVAEKENLERVEAEITLIYAAIQDKIKKLEKELDHFRVYSEREQRKKDEFER